LISKENYNMKIRFWGTRGSIPTPGRYVLKYGGNTPCVEVRCGETFLIFDAGSGLRELGGALLQELGTEPKKFNIFISHTHWDHIQGFPFFSMAYLPTTEIDFYGGSSVIDLEKLIYGQMEREYFPVTLSELASKINFKSLQESPFFLNGIKIEYTHLIHPSLSLGFRITYNDKIFVYATDNELSPDPDLKKVYEKSYGMLIENADVLVADCQYTSDEYKTKAGWGHSTMESVVEMASKHGVKNLFAFHHDPLHTDDEIDIMIENSRTKAVKGLSIFGAKEKSSIYL